MNWLASSGENASAPRSALGRIPGPCRRCRVLQTASGRRSLSILIVHTVALGSTFGEERVDRRRRHRRDRSAEVRARCWQYESHCILPSPRLVDLPRRRRRPVVEPACSSAGATVVRLSTMVSLAGRRSAFGVTDLGQDRVPARPVLLPQPAASRPKLTSGSGSTVPVGPRDSTLPLDRVGSVPLGARRVTTGSPTPVRHAATISVAAHHLLGPCHASVRRAWLRGRCPPRSAVWRRLPSSWRWRAGDGVRT